MRCERYQEVQIDLVVPHALRVLRNQGLLPRCLVGIRRGLGFSGNGGLYGRDTAREGHRSSSGSGRVAAARGGGTLLVRILELRAETRDDVLREGIRVEPAPAARSADEGLRVVGSGGCGRGTFARGCNR